MSDVPNLGAGGDAIDAVATGLVEVEGPAVWFPGTAGNDLTAAGFTIPSTLGILPLPHVDGALTILATDIPTDPASVGFVASTGQAVTVNRGVTGPVTVVVPDGATVLVNPDETVAANQLATPASTLFDWGVSDDVVVLWQGQRGNLPAGFSTLAGMAEIRSTYNSTDTAKVWGWVDAPLGSGSESVSVDSATSPFDEIVAFAGVDRSTETLLIETYTIAGLDQTASIPVTQGAATDTGGFASMSTTAGTFRAAGFHKGNGIFPSSEERAEIAANLFGAVPDPAPAYLISVEGDVLASPNGNWLASPIGA